jgi:bifunctional oligoribonuclease and PAP phosphatase NrnA
VTGTAREVADALRARQTFILTSHARPDGDAVGSQLALAFALDRLGKTVRLLDRDPVPEPYRSFPGIDRIQLVDRIDGRADAAVLLECSDLDRPEVPGLDGLFVVNIDHHAGNGLYGAVNWFDPTAAACGEMVADIIDALGVAWTPEIASHLYLAISTDTGSFRYGPISARTFEICRRIALAGVEPARLSRQIFDSFTIGRVKLTGALLGGMELHHADRLAILSFDDALLARCGASMDDTEGLVNLPLGAREVVAVALFKRQPSGGFRVSLRSKGDVDVRTVAMQWGGGGHRNAAGCGMTGELDAAKREMVQALTRAIDGASNRSDEVMK